MNASREPLADDLGIDTKTPSPARMYDYWLDGKDHFAADREAADKISELMPDAREAARENRAFLIRAVRYLVTEAGIRQFIDIGTGLPTQGSVHQVVHGTAKDARVIYADNDPMVVAHARALLAGDPAVDVIRADLRDPDGLLAAPAVQSLDFSRPVALLLAAVLHFIRDDERPGDIVATLTGALPPGSILILSHITADSLPSGISTAAQSVYAGASAPAVPRTLEQVAGFFDGLRLIEPGITPAYRWRPDPDPDPEKRSRALLYGGAGTKDQ